MEKKKEKRKPVDWEGVEREYLAGIRSLKDIGKGFSVSDAGIIKRAKRDGWVRDLAGKIRAKAESLVSVEQVSAEVSAQTKADERRVIDANAEMLANVIRSHRKDCGRLRAVVDVLLEKIETILSEPELFRQVGAICDTSGDDSGPDRVNELYRKVIELPVQTETTKKLAETLKLLIDLERKVFKLDVQDDPIEAAARGAAEGVSRAMLNFDDVKAVVVGA